MNTIIISDFKTKFGELLLGSYEDRLCLCDWKYRKMRNSIDNRIQTGLNAKYEYGTSEAIEFAKNELELYFNRKLIDFETPILMIGTDFQKSVWENLIKVKYGTTSTYLKLAEAINNPKSIRAVASANGANAISILIPCHRIIGTNGKLIGYAGGLTAKQKLLQLENSSNNSQLF